MTIGMPRIDRLPAQERGLTIGDFLVPIRISERLHTRARHLALILIGTALIALVRADLLLHPRQPGAVHRPDVRRPARRRGARLPARARRDAAVPARSASSACRSSPRASTGSTSSSARRAATSSGSCSRRRSSAGWPSSAGTATILGAIGAMLLGSVAIYAIGVPWLAYSAFGGDLAQGHRHGPAAVPAVGRPQARPRRRGVPGGVVVRRAPAGRPLGLAADGGDRRRSRHAVDGRGSSTAGFYGPRARRGGSTARRCSSSARGRGRCCSRSRIRSSPPASPSTPTSAADPWARLSGTLRSYLRIVYGTADDGARRDPAPERAAPRDPRRRARRRRPRAPRPPLQRARPGALAVGPRDPRRLDDRRLRRLDRAALAGRSGRATTRRRCPSGGRSASRRRASRPTSMRSSAYLDDMLAPGGPIEVGDRRPRARRGDPASAARPGRRGRRLAVQPPRRRCSTASRRAPTRGCSGRRSGCCRRTVREGYGLPWGLRAAARLDLARRDVAGLAADAPAVVPADAAGPPGRSSASAPGRRCWRPDRASGLDQYRVGNRARRAAADRPGSAARSASSSCTRSAEPVPIRLQVRPAARSRTAPCPSRRRIVEHRATLDVDDLVVAAVGVAP